MREGKMWMEAGEGLQLPIISTNGNTIFKTHGTRAWSQEIPITCECSSQDSAAHLSSLSSWVQTPVSDSPRIPFLFCTTSSSAFSRSLQGSSRRDDKVSAPSSPWRSPLPVKVPIWDPTSQGTLVFYHMSGARNNSLEGAFPPSPPVNKGTLYCWSIRSRRKAVNPDCYMAQRTAAPAKHSSYNKPCWCWRHLSARHFTHPHTQFLLCVSEWFQRWSFILL